jgi:hypothetical protein
VPGERNPLPLTRNETVVTGSSTLALSFVVFAIALGTRIGLLTLPPIYDELYHVTAALGWLETGTFSVLDGSYPRTWPYTVLVAQMFTVFGDDALWATRLPSVIAGSALVAVCFAWTRIRIGVTAGWIVAFAMLLWPLGIMLSQFTRFYAIHGLLSVCGLLAAYEASLGGWRRPTRLALAAASAIAFALAFLLQPATAIALLALFAWAGLVFALPAIWRSNWRWTILGAGLLLGCATLLVAHQTGLLGKLFAFYRWQPWPAQDDVFSYHRIWRDNYPTFWSLFPFAALIAIAARPRTGLFCAMIFAISFVVFSFGGIKNERYLYTAMPFFFAVWAIALQAAATKLLDWFHHDCELALRGVGLPTPTTTFTTIIGVFLLGFTILSNAAFQRGLDIVLGDGGIEKLQGRQRLDWSEAKATIEPWLSRSAVVVTTEEVFAVQYLGGFDYGFGKPRLSEIGGLKAGQLAPEFSIDPRNGRPIIGTIKSLSAIVSCYPTGVLLTAPGWGGRRGDFAADLTSAALLNGLKIERVRRKYFEVFAWQPGDKAMPRNCTGIPPTALRQVSVPQGAPLTNNGND